MAKQEKWIAVDYFLETIYCVRDSENQLHQAISELLDYSKNEINAAIRIYRLDANLYEEVVQKMEETGLTLNHFVRPRGLENEPTTFNL